MKSLYLNILRVSLSSLVVVGLVFNGLCALAFQNDACCCSRASSVERHHMTMENSASNDGCRCTPYAASCDLQSLPGPQTSFFITPSIRDFEPLDLLAAISTGMVSEQTAMKGNFRQSECLKSPLLTTPIYLQNSTFIF